MLAKPDKPVHVIFLLLVIPAFTGLLFYTVLSRSVLSAPFFLLLGLITAWFISLFNWQVPLLKIIAFTLPFSMEVNVSGNVMMFLPSEILVGIAAMSILFEFIRKPHYIREFMSREARWVFPLALSYVIFAIPSALPVVSLKSAIVNLTYILVFFFMLSHLLRIHRDLFPQLMISYSTGLIAVSILGLIRYHGYDWNPAVAKGIFQPFYNDHTIFGATAAMAGIFWLVYAGKQERAASRLFMYLVAASLIFLTALSTSRAATISLAFMVPVWLFLHFRLRLRHLVVLAGAIIFVGFIFHKQIIENIYRNPYVSRSHHSEWTGNLKSAGNITTDVSNVERLNRWYSGIKMFLEKPLTGFGPGTYQFVYIPYQKKELMNRLTVKNPWNIPENSGGTAHSEYILALSEMGVLGFLAFILVFMRLFWIAFAKAREHPAREHIVVAFVALSTYFFHAFFNNFLTTDKFAFLFWGLISWLMATYERAYE